MPKQSLISLRQWIWRVFAQSALVPLLLVETVLIAVYLLTNSSIREAQIDHLRQTALTDLQSAAQQEGRLINERLDSMASEVATLRTQVPQMLAVQRQKILDRFGDMQAELDPQRLEQELGAREAAVAAKEAELSDLRKQAAQHPKELEAAVARAVKETADRLTAEAKAREELLKKEIEGERNVFTARIDSLEKTAKEQSDRISALTKQLEAAYQKVQDIAVKTVEGASNSKSLAGLQQLLGEQLRKEGSRGRLREAHGGTLFLDEIGDMPLPLQTRLLRVLQDRSVTPVGAGHAVPVDFCLISATHCQLLQAAEQGRFRHDLYYRLNGLTVQLPALRERTDFAALTAQLLADLATEQGLPHPVQVAPDLLQRLAAHPWPGNLRQYASVLRTACAMLAEDEDQLGWEHLGDDIVQALQTAAPPLSARLPGLTTARPVPAAAVLSLQELSSAAIDQALQSARGNVSQAARQLGISRQTLYRKLAARVH